jgi:uncharacterized protein YecT (DUF1311 family)
MADDTLHGCPTRHRIGGRSSRKRDPDHPRRDGSWKASLIVLATWLLGAQPAPAGAMSLGDLTITIPSLTPMQACVDKAMGDIDLAQCTLAEDAAWDRRLNNAYGALRRLMPQRDFAGLQMFQRAWIVERDAACRDNGENGTSGRLSAASCRLRMTAIRASELEERVQSMR